MFHSTLKCVLSNLFVIKSKICEGAHIGPLAIFVGFLDKNCRFICYKSTILVQETNKYCRKKGVRDFFLQFSSRKNGKSTRYLKKIHKIFGPLFLAILSTRYLKKIHKIFGPLFSSILSTRYLKKIHKIFGPHFSSISLTRYLKKKSTRFLAHFSRRFH